VQIVVRLPTSSSHSHTQGSSRACVSYSRTTGSHSISKVCFVLSCAMCRSELSATSAQCELRFSLDAPDAYSVFIHLHARTHAHATRLPVNMQTASAVTLMDFVVVKIKLPDPTGNRIPVACLCVTTPIMYKTTDIIIITLGRRKSCCSASAYHLFLG